MRADRPLALVGTSVLLIGCGASTPFHPANPTDGAAGSPLGPSYILVPLPNDDDALLGRVLLDVPEKGRSLEEVSRPNECADRLTPKKDGPLASTFEDAQELAAGGKARAALGAFGFEGDVQMATHFYYKLDVSKRVSRTDTTDYLQCCKEKGSCGYGFVSALIYGDGQYATASENSAEGSVNIPIAGGAGGFVKAKILHRRNVHGYVAALVTITDQSKSKAITVMGDPAAAGIVLTEANLPEQVRTRFEAQKITVATCAAPLVMSQGKCGPSTSMAAPIESAYVFRDGSGEITENEFTRRYKTVTGSNDLDGAQVNRTPGMVTGGWVSLIIGAALVGSGSVAIATEPPTLPNGNSGQTGGAVLLGLGVLPLIIGVVFVATGSSDGVAADHSITKFDADLYVAKYNRALLRKTIQETRDRMQQLSGKLFDPSMFNIAPVVSPTFTGVTGTF